MSTIVDLSAARRKRHQPLAVSVESETDSNDPNRRWYLISSPNSHAVQDYIDGLIAEAESFGNGYGRFVGPKRAFGGDYQAMGWIKILDPRGVA
jgi:hypothetical protein